MKDCCKKMSWETWFYCGMKISPFYELDYWSGTFWATTKDLWCPDSTCNIYGIIDYTIPINGSGVLPPTSICFWFSKCVLYMFWYIKKSGWIVYFVYLNIFIDFFVFLYRQQKCQFSVHTISWCTCQFFV